MDRISVNPSLSDLYEIQHRTRLLYQMEEDLPAESQRQYRAMQAAAHGHSNIGIPAKVGKEFVAATRNPKKLPERARKGK